MAGADGCPGGWICLTRDLQAGTIQSHLFSSAHTLIGQRPAPAVLMVDIPIGLPEHGPRACDRAARALLGRRHACVFPAPIRPALQASNRVEASRITQQIDARKVSCQAWNIVPRIREVDAILREEPSLRDRVFEVHPELSFQEWNGGAVIDAGKKTAAGKQARQRLIGRRRLETIRRLYPRRLVGDDDLADAFAALWTAVRKWRGIAVPVPADPPRDATGLPMAIWR